METDYDEVLGVLALVLMIFLLLSIQSCVERITPVTGVQNRVRN